MRKILIRLRVNGADHHVAVRPAATLLDAVRDTLNLTGTKRGCDMGTCGCCTVVVDGRARLGCLTLAAEVEGADVRTIESLRCGESLHPLQRAFAECGASQCGFCTPGFLMTAASLLGRVDAPDRGQIADALAGNLCRCTGYTKILEAVERAGHELRDGRADRSAPGTDSHASEPRSAQGLAPVSGAGR